MQRIEFQDAPDAWPRDEILWKNLNIAIACNNMGMVFNAMTAWLKYNKALGYKGLEKRLRKEKVDAYILAKPTTPKDRLEMKFVDQYTLAELDYQLIVLMKPEKESMAEILTHHKSYEDNFNNISNAGIAVERNTYYELKRAGLNMFTFNSDRMLTNLCLGTKIMIPIKVNLEIEFNNVFKKYQDSEYTLSTKTYGHTKDGQEVYAMLGSKNGETKLLSSIGMMMGNPITGEDDIKFVLLQDQSTWTWEEDEKKEGESEVKDEPDDEAQSEKSDDENEEKSKDKKPAKKQKGKKQKKQSSDDMVVEDIEVEKPKKNAKKNSKKNSKKKTSSEPEKPKTKKSTKAQKESSEESSESEPKPKSKAKPKTKPKKTTKKKELKKA